MPRPFRVVRLEEHHRCRRRRGLRSVPVERERDLPVKGDRLAPSMYAASSSAPGTPFRNPRGIRLASGGDMAMRGRIRESGAFSRPKSRIWKKGDGEGLHGHGPGRQKHDRQGGPETEPEPESGQGGRGGRDEKGEPRRDEDRTARDDQTVDEVTAEFPLPEHPPIGVRRGWEGPRAGPLRLRLPGRFECFRRRRPLGGRRPRPPSEPAHKIHDGHGSSPCSRRRGGHRQARATAGTRCNMCNTYFALYNTWRVRTTRAHRQEVCTTLRAGDELRTNARIRQRPRSTPKRTRDPRKPSRGAEEPYLSLPSPSPPLPMDS